MHRLCSCEMDRILINILTLGTASRSRHWFQSSPLSMYESAKLYVPGHLTYLRFCSSAKKPWTWTGSPICELPASSGSGRKQNRRPSTSESPGSGSRLIAAPTHGRYPSSGSRNRFRNSGDTFQSVNQSNKFTYYMVNGSCLQ